MDHAAESAGPLWLKESAFLSAATGVQFVLTGATNRSTLVIPQHIAHFKDGQCDGGVIMGKFQNVFRAVVNEQRIFCKDDL